MRNFLKHFFKDESGMGVVEVILIIVGILTPYYGVSIKCIT
jgi:Flp pilus assembly pilin Flp